MAPPAAAHRAALGFSPHIGWAAVVALSGPPEAPAVVAKRRVDMATTFQKGAVYHVGQGLPLAGAEALVRDSEEEFVAIAREAVAAVLDALRGAGLDPVAGAILAGRPRPLPALEVILRSHPLVHAAEAALYRRVLLRASEGCGLAAALVPSADLPARVASAAGIPGRGVGALLAAMGKASGKPWARDQKEAALAAWLALAGGPAGVSARPARARLRPPPRRSSR